jgi:ketosteroid isomerase-like protein
MSFPARDDDFQRVEEFVGERTNMTQSSNHTQIQILVEDWARAVREKDMERVLEHHADNIVMFDVPVPLQARGMEAYKKTWELFFDHNPGGPGSFDVADLEIASSESVAYCHALVRVWGSTVRLTMGLRKDKGEWLIAHEHHSYPID